MSIYFIDYTIKKEMQIYHSHFSCRYCLFDHKKCQARDVWGHFRLKNFCQITKTRTTGTYRSKIQQYPYQSIVIYWNIQYNITRFRVRQANFI